MTDRDRYLALIDRIYAAALEPESWGSVMRDIAHLAGAGGGDVYVKGRDDTLLLMAYGGLPTDDFDEYLEHYHAINRRVPGLFASPEGTVTNDLSFYSPDELKSSPFHEDFLKKAGFQHHIGGTPFRDGETTSCFALHFDRGQEQPGEQKFDLVRPLMPHLRRAMMMQLRLMEADAKADGLAAIMDRMTTGVVLLDRKGRIAHQNREATRLLGVDDGAELGTWRGELWSSNAAVNAALRRIIADAVGSGAGGEFAERPQTDSVVLVENPETGTSLTVFVSMLPQMADTPGGEFRAAVFITDNHRQLTDGVNEVLQAIFSLTPAESRLAMAIGDGRTLKEYAHVAGITEGTARVVLKRVFDKTGTGRQAELAGLIVKTAGSVAG